MYKIKNLLLVLFAFLILSPLSTYAQWSGTDGFFGNDTQTEWRDESVDPAVLVVTTQNFGEAPIGNGLIVLGLSSIGYLIYKNRKKYKKSFIYLVICLFLLGMAGCHKKDITSHESDTVSVTFNSNRSRTDITPLGQVTFSSGDKLHVFASGIGATQPRYLGVLTCNESGSSVSFTGSIYTWQADEKLSFYYLGNNSVNTSGTTVIDFSNQLYDGIVSSENDLANIAKHYHIGCFQVVALDDALTTTFNGQLKNMMALAVFDTDEFDDGTNVKILSESDLNNMVKINLDGTIEYCVAGINDSDDNQSGHIIIGVGSSNKYVALLPKSSDTPANVSLIFTSNGKVSSSNLNLQIGTNSFLGYSNGSVTPYSISAIECSNDLYIDYPSPAECMTNPHVFTVMVGKTTPSNVNTVKKVVFSQGNLVYDQGRFKQHKNAWDVCQITNNSDIKVNTTFDRFGWGTSGYTFGQPIYQPYSNSTEQYSSTVGYGYGPLGSGSSMYKQSFHPDPKWRKQDWGWYQFGMDCFDEYTIPDDWTSYWRSMGSGEWTYLFNSRSTSSNGLIDYATGNEVSNARFVKANVEGQNGVIIFPDTYVHPTSIHLKYINSTSVNGLNNNLLSAQDFAELHNAGAEFLPFGGCYDKTNEQIVNASGQYWSCKTQTTDRAIYCKINVTEGVNTTTTMERYQGLFVRLVFQVEGVVE